MQIKLGADEFSCSPIFKDQFQDLQRWTGLENHCRWTPGPDGMTAEWLEKSPSLFLKEKISGDFLWQTQVSRVAPSAEFLERFRATPHADGADPLFFYNFNFWLRAEAPPGEEFLSAYPKHLGTGWNGMGDDHWHSLFTTAVWSEKSTPNNWVRLRRSPGYEKVCDVQNGVPHFPYNEPHCFSFALQGGRVRMYFDQTRVYDFDDRAPYAAGHIGFCVWLCTIRFHWTKLYRIESAC